MNLMDHALNIFGVTSGTFSPEDIKKDAPIKFVEWDGCMAEIRKETDDGFVIGLAPSPHDNGRYPGLFVNWKHRGKRWEPLDYVRCVNGQWEVWR